VRLTELGMLAFHQDMFTIAILSDEYK